MEIGSYSRLFYSYSWLREDGTSYYKGKGCGNRAFEKHQNGSRHINPPKESTRVIWQYHASEKDALETEVFFIAFRGRKDLGTGCLRNMTDGGEGTSGYRHTKEAIALITESSRNRIFSEEFCQRQREFMLGSHPSETTIQKMKERSTGNKYHLGHHHSPESNEKNRQSHLGKPSQMKGKHQTEEACKNYSKAAKKRFINAREKRVGHLVGKIIELRKLGYSQRKISEELKISSYDVNDTLIRNGYRKQNSPLKGRKIGPRKKKTQYEGEAA
jgi:hypothetical protein